MSLYQELDYSDKIRDVIGVQFSIMSPEEIQNRSVVHVTQTILYDSNGDPVIGGLFDPRMGVLDHGKICPTDNLDNRFCPGYFGHIELARPVFHIQFISIIQKILKCICIRCSKLLVDKNDPEIVEVRNNLKGKALFSAMVDRCSKISGIKICGVHSDDGCGAVQPHKFVKKELSKIFAIWKDKGLESLDNNQLLTAEFIYKIFKRISDDDCQCIGLDPRWCRPEWLICSMLPVCPPSVRPSVKQSNGQRSEDDITHKLIDIIKTNAHLKKKIDNEKSLENTVDEWTQVLQYHIATLVDNELPNVNASTHRSGRALKTFRQRLKGKEGRIRGNLMGKRVNFSARSVITPDPNIKIDELGVPKKIAMNLTFPEIVTQYNKKELLKYVRNGTSVYPGAKSVKRKTDGKTIALQYVDSSSMILYIGDTVNRHLIDGDMVLFNRQPSLHKMSMMGHRVRVMEHNTFRLNVSVTKPYNADFDGDEMNMHVPQSYQTVAELKYLAAVPLQIISPREHKPVISLVQDSLLGLNRITNDDVYLNRDEMMNILIYLNGFNGVLPLPIQTIPYKRWSGRQLISLALPKGLNINMQNNSYDDSLPDDKVNHVIIKDGEHIQGKIDSKIMNSNTSGLIHIIYNDYGIKVTQQVLDDLQNIITRYLLLTGFSVGIGDLVANHETNEKIRNVIIRTKKQVSKVTQQVHQNMFENVSSDNVNDEFEKKVNNLLNKAISEVGNIGLKSLNTNNRMVNMVAAGSKGKNVNIAQMIACLGQQNVDGKRIPNSYNNRTLPHFRQFDVSPESKGFVENSFMTGLDPTEFFHHAMGGREGLIDTAVKTSETGYIQRKLIKSMEDCKTVYDLSVRTSIGGIVQFKYGEDGMDYNKIESQKCEILSKDFETVKKTHLFMENEEWYNFMSTKTIKDMKKHKQYQERLEQYFEKIISNIHLLKGYVFSDNHMTKIRFPVNLFRIIQSVKAQFNISASMMSNLNPLYVIDKIEALIVSLNKDNLGNELFNILIHEYLSPKVLVKKLRISKIAFDYILETIKMKYFNSFVEVSDMVGPIAAQSIGEPATQMTLNTFHFAGVSSKSNVTRGVPRLKELLHISKNIKSPSTTIYLDEETRYDKTNSNNILNKLELTRLKDLIKSIKIYYDPNDNQSTVDEDHDFLKMYQMFEDIDPTIVNEEDKSDWVIRFEFNKQDMINKNITMEYIYHKLTTNYGNEIRCVYSDDNSNKLIFRIRILKFKKNDTVNDINLLKSISQNMRDKVVIKGIDGINNVSMFKNKNNYEIVGHDFKQKDEWVLSTNGINILEIMDCSNVDKTRTYSNDIHEMYSVFGIEVARKILLNEIREVIEASGNYVNYRHLSLLCDMMTTRGYLMSIDRFGINKGNIGPLAKCSFEETTDQLFKASIFGEIDPLKGVSANIMMGQVPPCGTGDSEIILDEQLIQNIFPEEEIEIDDMDEWVKQDYCQDNIGINISSDIVGQDNTEGIPVPEIEL